MALCRPLVSVQSPAGKTPSQPQLMPSVFMTPVRPDLIRFVHTNMAKNKRQAYGVALNAGYQTSAQSWGTGRAVSRIPRVQGGGTHRAGQGAFGNMCAGGGMFNPNKTWRRWHRRINVTQKRHAVASAIAASGIPALLMARGHRISEVPEIPLVVSDEAQNITKTKQAIQLLESVGCGEDLQKVSDSKKVRCGKGKMRNRRYVMRRGPLVIYAEDSGISRAFRNIPGVDLCHVDRLNLLDLAPGGSLGRLCMWTESAFARLRSIYGSLTKEGTSECKKGYHLMRPMMANADVSRIINSDEVQSVLRPVVQASRRRTQHRNPLKNTSVMCRLNPARKHLRMLAQLSIIKGTKQHELVQHKKRKNQVTAKGSSKKAKKFFSDMMGSFVPKIEEVEE